MTVKPSGLGGLNPAGLADRVRQLAARLGLTVQVGYITGDDLLPRIGELQAAGHPLAAGVLAASVTLAFRLCAALPRSRGSSGRW